MTQISDETYRYAIMAGMTPAGAKVLFAMLFFHGLHGVNDIARMTAMNRGTVRNALINLEQLGFVNNTGRYEAWILTTRARQLVLGEGEILTLAADEDMTAVEAEGEILTLAPDDAAPGEDAADAEAAETGGLGDLEGENLTLASSSSLTNFSRSVSQSVKTTTTQTDTHAAESVELLVHEGVPRPLAVQAVEKALAGGWNPQRVLEAVWGWFDYAETGRGLQIRQIGFLIVKRLMQLQDPPELTDHERSELDRRHALAAAVEGRR